MCTRYQTKIPRQKKSRVLFPLEFSPQFLLPPNNTKISKDLFSFFLLLTYKTKPYPHESTHIIKKNPQFISFLNTNTNTNNKEKFPRSFPFHVQANRRRNQGLSYYTLRYTLLLLSYTYLYSFLVKFSFPKPMHDSLKPTTCGENFKKKLKKVRERERESGKSLKLTTILHNDMGRGGPRTRKGECERERKSL